MHSSTVKDWFEEAAKKFGEGKLQDALTLFDAVLQQHICHPLAVSQAANTLCHMGSYGLAIALHSYASMLTNGSPEVMGNLAVALRHAHFYDEAVEVGQRALARIEKDTGEWPDEALSAVLGNLAGAFVNMGCPGQGIPYGKRAMALCGDGIPNASHENNLGLLMLEAGQWSSGWKHWRRRLETRPYDDWRHYAGEEWKGEPVESLVIHGEQGLGDEIMFLGCMDDVRTKHAGRTVIECNHKLNSLMARSFPECEIIAKEQDLDEPCAAWIPMGNLPALFRGGLPPKRSGYLKPDPDLVEEFQHELSRKPWFVIAMWGGVKSTHEGIRNPMPHEWKPLIAAIRERGGEVYSIQYGPHAQYLADTAGVELLEGVGENMEEQAACIAASNGLISVPQTALHIAGGVGQRCIGLIGSRPAWRYGVSGPMPWYQMVKILRAEQKPRKEGERREDDWAQLFNRVTYEVTQWL